MSRQSGWEPTTEAEVALYDALLAGDQERYFRILAKVELLLPVSADAAAGRSPMGWATWTSNDHTHLLAFTSLHSMRTCLAEHAGAARKLAISDLANVWPNQDWWLAVNPGLPVEGYLPPWFVAQLSLGDTRLPNQISAGPRDRLERVQALERAKAARAAGVHAHQRDPLRVHATVSQRALPTSNSPYSVSERLGAADAAHTWLDAEVTSVRSVDEPQEDFARSARSAAGRTSGGRSADDAFPLPRRERPVEQAGAWHGAAPAAPSAEEVARIQSAHARAVDELAAAWATSAGVKEAQATQAGQATAQAATYAPSYTPSYAPSYAPSNSAPSYSAPISETHRVDETPAGSWGRSGSSRSTTWPSPPRETEEVTTRVPPPEPREFEDESKRVNGHAAERAGDRPRHAEPEPAFIPANQVEADLYEAAEAGNTDSFLSTLLLATVFIPKGTGTENGEWRPQPIDGEPHLICYTSSQHLPEGLELVSVRFIKLIMNWPDPSWSFAVNPGTAVGATLPGGQLLALASWAKEVGLARDDDAEGEPEKVERAGAVAGRANPELTMLQKAVAPSQVNYYLDRGYDRVSGFVHRAHEVEHLRDAQRMRKALGLDYEGSPFQQTDKEIYLLRWPAYRPNLYRIPYGGQTEAAMKAMQGWVVERAPFRGNGFAPGESKEIIAEFKVDSARLPHGTQLIRMRDDGQEIIAAVLDSDNQRWVRRA